MRLNIFINHLGNRQFVGVIEEQNNRIFFEYAPDFIKTGFSISPFLLPLQSGVFEEEKRVFDGLFGVFNDSLPDGWGCLLLDRQLQKQGLSLNQISPLQRLAMIGKNPMGALEYEPIIENSVDFEPILNLDSLSYEADKLLEGQSSNVLDELLTLNGSAQGARPKIVAMVSKDKTSIIHGNKKANDYEPWLIKFSSQDDNKDIGAIEYVYSLMAKEAGIEMPETYLFSSKHCAGHFGVKRFDRTDDGQKIHVHTASGLLNASHRYASLDYSNLLRLTLNLTKDHREVEKLIRLMIFNVLGKNKDDHSKNFAFVMNKNLEWKLSPAYDLTPSEGINGEQTAMVNGKGKNIEIGDIVKVAEPFGFKEKEIQEIISQTTLALTPFDKIMKKIKKL